MSVADRAVSSREATVGDVPVFWWEAPSAPRAPVLYLHGVPTSSDDFLPFLRRTGGIALDLPGFGRSGKPATFDYSFEGYGRFLEEFARHLELERASLLVHDWGTVGLALARPQMLERLVVVAGLPLGASYRPHRMARVWATPVLGELAMGFTSRWVLRRLIRRVTTTRGEEADALVERIWSHFDHGTQRAILKLYRSPFGEAQQRAGEHLGELKCPALVVWGADDPLAPPAFAEGYPEALAGPAYVEVVERASHWPWIDRPETIDTVVEFLRPSGVSGP